MSRSASPWKPSRCGSQTRAPKTNEDTTQNAAAAHFGLEFRVYAVRLKAELQTSQSSAQAAGWAAAGGLRAARRLRLR